MSERTERSEGHERTQRQQSVSERSEGHERSDVTKMTAAQGWFHARPMPAADLAGWLARYRPLRPGREPGALAAT